MCKASPAEGLGGCEQENSRRQLPLGSGTMGTAGGLGLGPLLLHGRGIVLVHGENYFLEWGGGSAGTHHGELPTPLPPHPPTRLYTQYIHTHALARGDRERATAPLRAARQCHWERKNNQKPQPLQELTHCLLLGFVVRLYLRS